MTAVREVSDDDLAFLLYLSTFRVQHGRLPRVGEIAEARGLTRPGVKQTIRRLRALGQLGDCYVPRGPVPYLLAVK